MRAPKQNTQREGNSLAAQRQRLLAWLKKHGKITTIEARRELDIMSPASRVLELRRNFEIELQWVWCQTDSRSTWHRVGLYVLKRSRKV
jgi:hypothetical protein